MASRAAARLVLLPAAPCWRPLAVPLRSRGTIRDTRVAPGARARGARSARQQASCLAVALGSRLGSRHRRCARLPATRRGPTPGAHPAQPASVRSSTSSVAPSRWSSGLLCPAAAAAPRCCCTRCGDAQQRRSARPHSVAAAAPGCPQLHPTAARRSAVACYTLLRPAAPAVLRPAAASSARAARARAGLALVLPATANVHS
jgi:hypothetical protein